MPYAVEASLFVVSLITVVLAYLYFALRGPIRRFRYAHNTIKAYYKTVYKVALEGDYYLINDFANKTAEAEPFHIDHILIGNKYIYCIRDRYYDGAVLATENDGAWVLYRKKKAEYIHNPLKRNRLRIERLSLMNDTDRKIFVNIVLINNDCFITPIEHTSEEEEYVVSLRMFPKLIASMEKRTDVEPLDPNQTALVARDYAELNLNGHQ